MRPIDCSGLVEVNRQVEQLVEQSIRHFELALLVKEEEKLLG